MLSSGAFNALLKTLEEPPEHVKFILATTEPQKLPATILSRCQRFDFKRIPNEDIIKRLKVVCDESDIEITEGALNIIAVLSEGAMRDALSILERCIQDGDNKIDEDKIKDLVGIPKITFVHNITEGIIEYDVDKALQSINNVLEDGKDLDNFIWEIIKYIKDILIYKSSGKADLYNEEEIDNMKVIAEKVSKERLVNLVYELSNLENDMKWSTQKNIMFQAGIIKLCSREIGVGDGIEARLEKIEGYLKSGKLVVSNQNINSNTQNINSVNYINQNASKSEYMSKEQHISKVETADVNNMTKAKIQKITAINKKEYSSDLTKSWPKIVNDLKQSGKIVLYTNLMNTQAEEINDMTVGIKFPKGLTSFGKTVLEKQENIREISNLVSIACGKEMQIKYISEMQNQVVKHNPEDDIKKLANDSDIPFNVID